MEMDGCLNTTDNVNTKDNASALLVGIANMKFPQQD